MKSKGFTLLELLIVVIVIGALASVALPQFSKMVKRARAAEAVSGLGAFSTAELVYYQERSTFTNTKADLPVDVNETNFTYTISGASSTSVVIAAVGTGSSHSGISATMTVFNGGTRTEPRTTVS
jgi:prepilin-type N-terminal cleavage/methylation domain-containing protein